MRGGKVRGAPIFERDGCRHRLYDRNLAGRPLQGHDALWVGRPETSCSRSAIALFGSAGLRKAIGEGCGGVS